MLLFYNPFVYAFGFIAEVYANLYDFAAIFCKRLGITFCVYLTDCFFSATVQLKFHYVNIIGCFQY